MKAKYLVGVLWLPGFIAITVLAGLLAKGLKAAEMNPPPIATVRVAPATILSVRMVALRQRDPTAKGEYRDVVRVIVRNDTMKPFVRAILVGVDHARTRGFWPPVLGSKPVTKFVGAKPPVWQLSLAPGKTRIIYFTIRSLPDVADYCVGTDNVLWRCTYN